MLRQGRWPLSLVHMLLIINAGMYLLELSFEKQLISTLALWPVPGAESFGFSYYGPRFQFWQLASYSFLHGSVTHLLLNMYALWMFGTRMERVWGVKAFAVYYFTCVIGAGLVQLLVAASGISGEGGMYPTLGASGGVFGVLLAFGLTFPNERLLLVFPPVALKAKWFVLIYGAIELFNGVTGTMAGVAHFAHLGGMLFGFMLLLYWRSQPSRYR